MKRIVCFGDSNTWGYNPNDGERYSESERWPCLMANILGKDFTVIEEGMNGRTAVFEDPTEDFRNGSKYILPCLLTQKPVDLLIIMLGTNDMKAIFNANPFFITKGVAKLVDMAQKSECGRNSFSPKILVAAPIEIGKNILKSEWAEFFHDFSVQISKLLPEYYAQMAEEYGCYFINAAEFARPSEADNIHLDVDGHYKLAQAMARKVKEIFV